MAMRDFFSALLGLFLFAATWGKAAQVEVRVMNVASGAGTVRVALCTARQWSTRDCSYGARIPARAGLLVVTVAGVPPGSYGILVHHDTNDDDSINRNLLGVPTEGIGFSRNPTIRFGIPRFADAAIEISAADFSADVTLQFEAKGAPDFEK